MPLQVYSTLGRKKEPFQTVAPGRVGMYLCGPTVYKPSHIGHMVGPIIFDTIKRYLAYSGYQVTFVVNITDVDDKLIVRAKEQGTTVKDLAEKMTSDYVDCLKSLNVSTGIDLMPRATEHIPEMLAMIQKLIDKGLAYPAGGDVYFDISKDADYGKLCNRDPEQLEAGSRIEVSEKKRNAGDFALWKGSKPGEPAWESPWGNGRPGWHIECSAMSMKYLGQTLDIHGGGLDLQFPHHENELAQSESYSEQPFARYWMHNGLLKMGSSKMAGSVGNVVNVTDLLKKHHPETVRFLILNTHYRSPIEYSDDRFVELRKALDSFYRFFERYERITGETFYSLKPPATRKEHDDRDVAPSADDDWCHAEFCAHMDDDFNTGGACGVLFELLSRLNRLADAQRDFVDEKSRSSDAFKNFKRGANVLRELSNILGLFWAPHEQTSLGGGDELVAGLMQLLIEIRNNLRSVAKKITVKNDPVRKEMFEQTDIIRKRLAEMKVTLEDRPDGTGWRIG